MEFRVKQSPRLLNCFHAQLSMKYQLLIEIKIPTNKEVSCFQSLSCCIYEQDKFHAQLSMKKVL